MTVIQSSKLQQLGWINHASTVTVLTCVGRLAGKGPRSERHAAKILSIMGHFLCYFYLQRIPTLVVVGLTGKKLPYPKNTGNDSVGNVFLAVLIYSLHLSIRYHSVAT